MLNINLNNLFKVLTITALIFLIFSLYYIIVNGEANGYEISIYNAFPLFFWITILLCLFFGITIVVLNIYRNNNSNFWSIGIIIIIITNLIILLLPYFRGYAIYGRGDTLSHLGQIKIIFENNHLSNLNYYPITHLLGDIIIQITGISRNIVVNFLYSIYYLFYFFGILILSKILTKDKKQRVMIIALSTPLLFSRFHTLIHPSFFSLYMIPYILYFYQLYIKKREIKYNILMIITIFWLIFCHPTAAIFLIIIFSSILIIIYLYRILKKFKKIIKYKEMNLNYKSPATLIIFIITIFFSWYFNFPNFTTSFKTVYDWLYLDTGIAVSDKYFNLVSMANLNINQLSYFFIKKYGAISIYLIISLISIIFIFKNTIKTHNKQDITSPLFVYGFLFLIGLIFSSILFFNDFVEDNPDRVLRFFIIFSIILNGLISYEIYKKINRNKIKKLFYILFLFIILFSSYIGVFNVYNSPFVGQQNFQVTNYDIQGMKFFLNKLDNSIITSTRNNFLFKGFENLLMESEIENNDRIKLDQEIIPTHFGYNGNTSISNTFNYSKRYIVLSKFDILFHLAYPKNAQLNAYQLNQQDINKLNNDISASIIYSNIEFWTWIVQ